MAVVVNPTQLALKAAARKMVFDSDIFT